MDNIKANPYSYCSDEIITKTFLKYQTNFLHNKPNLRIPQLKLQQMEMQYIEDRMLKYFKKHFEKKSLIIIHKIKEYYTNNPNSFNDYLLDNHNAIIELVDPIKKDKTTSLSILNANYKTNYTKNVSIEIEDLFQKAFVTPTLNFIENNYPLLLLENNIFTSPIRNLFIDLNLDQLTLKKLPDNCTNGKQNATWSSLNSSFFYLEYNSFTDLLSYRNYILEVCAQFTTYLDNLPKIIIDPCERITMYNKIKAYIFQSLSQFEIIPKKNNTPGVHLPNYMRKDTLALLKHYIGGNFISKQEVMFNPGLGDFQDLQYCLGKKALAHVESKIHLLSLTIDKINMPIEPSCNQSCEIDEKDKISTNLTVRQLAYLVRCMYEEGILNEPNKTVLFRKISAYIRSTQQSNMSPISLKNKSLTYEEDTINFCIEKLTHMMQFAKKERDKELSSICK